MLLRVEGLHVHYEAKEALRDVGMRVEEHSFVCLLGANGAGKSTYLRTLAGLKRRSAGRIELKGVRIDALPADRIVGAGLALVPEGRRVFPYMSVLDNLLMGAFLRWRDAEKNSQNLERIYHYFPVLRDRAKQKAGTLSGGEQQMLAIGRALMARPTLLALDEPSLGLAPLVVAEIGRLLQKLNREEDIGVLLVEQNVRLGLAIAARIYLLDLGRIVLEGAPAEVKNDEYIKRAYLGG